MTNLAQDGKKYDWVDLDLRTLWERMAHRGLFSLNSDLES
jgi:predicted heme/steroid binding protein